MRLVHEQAVHAEFLKGQRVVFLCSAASLKFGFEAFSLPSPVLSRAAGWNESACSPLDHFQLVKLLLEESFLRVRESGMRSKPECVTMTASQLPVAMRLKASSGLRLEILFAGDQDVRAGIQCQQFGRELAEHVIGNGEHRFAGEAQPFQFHRGGDHCVRLAGADNVASNVFGVCRSARHRPFGGDG